MMNIRPARMLLAGVGLVLALAVAYAAYETATHYPKRFKPVVEGRLYRSGEVRPEHLARLRDEVGIERVICLLDANAPVTQAERAAAQRLGLEWHNLSMRGNGASKLAQRDRLRDLLADPNAPPTLVHCSAGVNRTGLAVGLYRIDQEGWTYEQVYEELLANDFDDLPKHENLRAALRAAADPNASPPYPDAVPEADNEANAPAQPR